MTQVPKSRRDFIRASSLLVAGGAVTGGLAIGRSAHAVGSDLVRVGLIGCGKRGRDVVLHALNTTSGPVRLVAMGDVFGDRLQAAYRHLKSVHGDKVDVPVERRFVGLDAYRAVLNEDPQLVVLGAPPAFRPLHFEAAVEAGKHVFLEQPLAVDPPGVRRAVQAATVARQRNLSVAVGLRHRHDSAYRETIAQLQQGKIGVPLVLRIYRNTGELRPQPRHPGQSDLEYQLRNGPLFTWLSGDQIADQHVHELDVGNWLLQSTPVSANAQGGCRGESRGADSQDTDTAAFDQFFCEFVYPQGARMFSQCRRAAQAWNVVAAHAHATAGQADISGGKIYDLAGERIWRADAPRGGPLQQHEDFIAALRAGRIVNEVETAARSTLTAILGRMAAYGGQFITWDEVCASNATLANPDVLLSLEDPAPAASTAIG